MLQAIRERVTGIVAIFILGLLAVPFLFFGVDSYIRDVPRDSVAQVGDIEITVSDFQSEFARHRARLRQERPEEYDDLAVNQPQYRREFLDDMIDQRLLRQHARDLGLQVSPGALREVIRSIPAFQVDGQFQPEIYEDRLRAGGRSPRQFEREVSQDLLLRMVPTAVSDSSVVTEREVDRWLRLQNETRQVAMVPVDAAPFEEPDAVGDEDIQAYYDENTGDENTGDQNSGEFMRPERIVLEYVELDADSLVVDHEVGEQELRQRYEAVQARYMIPEQRRARHILITADGRDDQQARELARSLHERIEDGEDFAELAGEYSEDPGSAAAGGDLGWIEPDDMTPAFEQALFELEAAGEVSEPVQTDFGWHLIALDEIRPARGQSFEEARAEIEEELREERAADLYFEQLDRLVDLVYAEPDHLEFVADDLGLEVNTIGPFSREDAEGIAADPRVQQEAFSDMVLLDRQISEPIELDDMHTVVIQVAEHEPARPRELDEVRDEIRSRIARERAREAAREYAESLLDEAGEAGAELEAVAEREELEWNEQTVGRRDFQLGTRLLDELFKLPVPGETPGVHVIPRSGGWTVVRLEEVTPGNPAAAEQVERRVAGQQIRFTQAAQEVQSLLAWLRDNTEINVVEDRL